MSKECMSDEDEKMPDHIWSNIIVVECPELKALTPEQLELVRKAADYAYGVGVYNGIEECRRGCDAI